MGSIVSRFDSDLCRKWQGTTSFIPEEKRGVCHLHQKPDDVRSRIATALLSVACAHTDLIYLYIYSLILFLGFLELDLQHPDADMRGTRPKTHRNEVS